MPSRHTADDGGGAGLLEYVVAAAGVAVILAPFVVGAHALWIALALGVGLLLILGSVMAASGGVPDGPPPRRSG